MANSSRANIVNADQYMRIVSHYEACLEKHGDSHLGVDWPNREDAETRYRIMLDVARESGSDESSLLDFGCGTSHLYESMLRHGIEGFKYAGLDISPKFTAIAKEKFPQVTYYTLDVLQEPTLLPSFDYIVMNGVFTEKCGMSFEDMFSYFTRLIGVVFAKTRVGAAFNVMSKHVDWERDDLFHLSFDALASFLRREISANFVFRSDYGLREYTTYVYK